MDKGIGVGAEEEEEEEEKGRETREGVRVCVYGEERGLLVWLCEVVVMVVAALRRVPAAAGGGACVCVCLCLCPWRWVCRGCGSKCRCLGV